MKSSFDFTPYHKFNYIFDNSATGKTWLAKAIQKSYKNAQTNADNDIIVFNSYNFSFFDPTKDYKQLVIIDEDMFPMINREHWWKPIQQSPNVYLIIGRSIPCELSLDYRAVYTLSYKNQHYELKRKYPDYTVFKYNKKYVTEDSNSGYQYFSSRFENVSSVHGKNNIKYIDSDTTYIADGAAFALILSTLNNTYKDLSNLFLPDSFEALIISYTQSNLARKIYREAHRDEVLKFNSIEQYFTLMVKALYKDYDKKKLPEYMKDFDLINIQPYGITPSIAKNHKINIYDLDACYKLAKELGLI